jgi:hypothetical protein
MSPSIYNLFRFTTMMGLLLPAVQSARESGGYGSGPYLPSTYKDSSVLSPGELSALQRLAAALAKDPLLVARFILDPVRILNAYGILIGMGERSLFTRFVQAFS